MKVYYIAGPITGVDAYHEVFDAVEFSLTAKGHTAINPASLPQGFTQGQYMDICLAMIRACDGVVMLPGWESSAGAVCEHSYAVKLGIEIIYEGGQSDRANR